MTAVKRESQLINARRACLALIPLATDDAEIAAEAVILTRTAHGELIADLVDQFARLDAAERRQSEQARKKGKKGGRPRLPEQQLKPGSKRSRKSRARKH